MDLDSKEPCPDHRSGAFFISGPKKASRALMITT